MLTSSDAAFRAEAVAATLEPSRVGSTPSAMSSTTPGIPFPRESQVPA